MGQIWAAAPTFYLFTLFLVNTGYLFILERCWGFRRGLKVCQCRNGGALKRSGEEDILTESSSTLQPTSLDGDER
jgi:hypothetical protein